ncbi:MAG: L-fucokinase, partial [Phycisphaeraceae bacterium]
MARFDHVILTAANEAQARGYRAQIDWRLKQGVLDAATRYHVVADPGGRRVGSLGATLGVLRHLADQLIAERPAKNFEELFADQRVLICHSGGDSRRLPAYAAQGKIFVPLPTSRRGQPAALFDLILDNVEKLPVPSQGQVLIYTGDVLLTFDPNAVDFELPGAGVVGVAYPGSLDVGSRHGVYVSGSGTANERTIPVRDFLQKPDEAEARAAGAVDPVNRVLIDTGILSLDPKTTEKMLKYAGLSPRGRRVIADRRGVLADLEAGRSRGLDLYEEFTMAMPEAMTAARYDREVIGPNADTAHRRRLTALYRAMRGCKFAVNVLPWCDFFHIGSSREFLVNIATLNRTAQTYGFAPLHGAAVCDGVALEGSFIYDSVLDHRRIRAAGQTLIEACDVDVPLQLDGGNILVGLPAMRGHSSGPAGLAGFAVRLRKGLGLVVLPVG